MSSYSHRPKAPRHRPLHPCQNPGQRAGPVRQRIGDNRQVQPGKAARVTIGVDRNRAHLRGQSPRDMRHQWRPAQRQQRLVHPAKAAAQPSGQNHPRQRGTFHFGR